MATEKTPNYTAEMVQTMTTMYRTLRDTEGKTNAQAVAAIGKAVNRPTKSVIAKLVREGVYVKETAPVKVATDNGPTKKDMLNALERVAPDFPVDGLNPATKEAIAEVLAIFESLHRGNEEAAESEAV